MIATKLTTELAESIADSDAETTGALDAPDAHGDGSSFVTETDLPFTALELATFKHAMLKKAYQGDLRAAGIVIALMKTRPFIHACDVDAYRKLLEKFARKSLGPEADAYLPAPKTDAQRAAFTRQMEDLADEFTGDELERRRAALEAEFHGTTRTTADAESVGDSGATLAAAPVAKSPHLQRRADGRHSEFSDECPLEDGAMFDPPRPPRPPRLNRSQPPTGSRVPLPATSVPPRSPSATPPAPSMAVPHTPRATAVSPGNASASLANWPSGIARYQIGQELGRGGMGLVRLAVDPAFHREMAIKVMIDPEDAASRAAFIDEAQITGQLEHPNIVPVHDLGTDAQGRPFLTMKRVQGQTLKQMLDTRALNEPGEWRADEAQMLPIFAKIAEAIAYAHSRGVIHRDLKPDNIMLGEFGEVLVMDWGLAKPLGGPDVRRAPIRTDRRGTEGAEFTVEGEIFGTPAYMSPEQAQGDVAAVDERSDIYALGGILYTMLTHERPRKGASAITVVEEARSGRIVPPIVRAPKRRVPQDLNAIVTKALARRPADRYRTVYDLLADVTAYQSNLPISARRDSLATAAVKWTRRHPQATLAASFLLVSSLVVTVIAGVFIARAADAEREGHIAAERQAAAEKLAASEAERRKESETIAAERAALVQAMRANDFAHVLTLLGDKLQKDRSEAVRDYDLKFAAAEAADKTWEQFSEELSPADRETYLAAFEDLFRAHTIWNVEVTADDYINYAQMIWVVKRDPFEQIAALNRALELNPNSFRAWINLSSARFKAGSYREAVDAANRGLALSPNHPVGLYNRAIAYRGLRNFRAAMPDFDAAVRAAPNMAGMLYERGQTRYIVGDKDGAMADYNEVIRRWPGYAVAYLRRGEIKFEWGNKREALADFETAIDLDAAIPDAYFFRARIRREGGNIAGAMGDLSRAIDLNGRFGDALALRGAIYLEMQQFTAALADLDRALDLAPNDTKSIANRASARASLGNTAGAIADFEYLVERTPNDWRVWYNFAISLREAGQTTRAVTALQSAYRLCDVPNLRGQMASLLRQWGATVPD